MGDRADVWQGTLALMVLKTIESMGPIHGYGIARRIEQTSGDLLSLNYGTLYPALLKLEQRLAFIRENLDTRGLEEEFEKGHSLKKRSPQRHRVTEKAR